MSVAGWGNAGKIHLEDAHENLCVSVSPVESMFMSLISGKVKSLGAEQCGQRWLHS